MDYQLPEIPYVKLQFHLTASDNAMLPACKGSMLRGVLGHALKLTVCSMGSGQMCECCVLKRQCVYTHFFETYIEKEPPPLFKGLKATPRPFIISSDLRQTRYEKGDSFRFEMTVIGNAVEKIPFVVIAFERAAALGFTKRKHPFTVNRVDVLNGSWQPFFENREFQETLVVQKTGTDRAAPSHLTLRFLSPTKLIINGKPVSEFTFRQLVFKMLRRTLEMAHFHVHDADSDYHFKHYLDEANAVQLTPGKIYWKDWQRKSNRQDRRISMGGFMGDVTLEGDLEPFYPILKAAEVLHVGKGTVFGNGKVKIDVP
ncbi:CRISPR system precrRNA processing endoribonuclease RAMP protein Cas6 [bacterium]|nr:CRISPR system precrRNA processing endoribonuclease RAMP protein Cas6 [bacterium]